MSYPMSHMAYTDCYEAMDQAMADTKGVRLKVPNRTAAEYLRNRINYARALSRKQNEKIYAPDHPLHGASAYDGLVCRIREHNGSTWVYVEQNSARYSELEPLSEVEELPLAPAPVHNAPAPTPVPMPTSTRIKRI